MSIRSAILATNPDVYWELQEQPGAVVAADSSGHGNAGLFTGSYVLGIPGPEAGTFALGAAAPQAGVSISGSNPVFGGGPFTGMCWFGASALGTSGNGLIYNGNGGSTGEGMVLAGTQVQLLYGGLGVVSTGYFASIAFWHQYAWRLTASVNQAAFVDGAQVYSAPAGVPHPVLAFDPLVGQCPDIGAIAHVAYWNSALSNADINSIWVAGPGATSAPSLTGRGANDVDVLAILDLLAQILRAVRKTY